MAVLAFVFLVALRFPAWALVYNRPTHSSPIAISRDDQLIWVVNPSDDSVSVIRPDNHTRLAKITVGDEPQSIALTPDGRYAYVANAAAGTVTAIKINNPAWGTFSAQVDNTFGNNGHLTTGAEPWNIVTSPDGLRVFVANSGQDTITVIDATTHTIIGHVDLRKSIANDPDRSRHFQPRGLAITMDNTKLYVTRFLSFTRTGGRQGDDFGKEGIVAILDINTSSTFIGDYSVSRVVVLAPQITGFRFPGLTNDTAAFPNQLQSIVIRGDRAFLPNIAASPSGPLRFNLDTHAFLNQIGAVTGSSATNIPALNLHLGARDPEPGKRREFFANPWAVAFTSESGAGSAYVVSAGSDLLVKLNVAADNSVSFTVDNDTTRYIDLNDPFNPATSGANAAKNPQGIAITSSGGRAYVANFVSRNVSVVNLTNDAVIAVVSAFDLPARGSPTETNLVGAEMFFSSRGNFDSIPGTNSLRDRLSSEGWQSCASCHFKGLTDGVIWQFATGPRKSVPLNSTFNPHDRSQQRLLNYSAIFDEVEDFETNIRNVSGPGPLAGGALDPNHGLLIGDNGSLNVTPTAINAFTLPNANRPQMTVTLPGSTNKVSALTALREWVRNAVRTPNAPISDLPNGASTLDIATGRSLFAQAGCAKCHGGPSWTASLKDFTSPPSASEIFTERNPTPFAGNPVGAQYLNRFLRDIGSFNLGVAGQGTPLGDNIGADEMAAPAVVNNVLQAPQDALGRDYNNDSKGNGFNVPSLLGIHAMPPYMHNGAAESLAAVVGDMNHRTDNGRLPDRLSNPLDRARVVAFLETIDAVTAEVVITDTVAQPDALTTAQNTALVFLLADLGTNDVPGTANGTNTKLTVVSVSNTSAHGGAASLGDYGLAVWTNRYNGPGNLADVAYAVAVDNSGNAFVTGSSAGSGSSVDYATIKYLSSGAAVWTNRYNGPGNSGNYDQARAIAVDSGGNAYVTGSSFPSAGLDDYATIKYLPDGTTGWIGRYSAGTGSTSGADVAIAVAVDTSGNVYVTGYSSFLWNSKPEYVTIKYLSNGTPVWTNRYGGEGNGAVATALALDSGNDVYVTGYLPSSTGGYGSYATIRYRGDGTAVWTNRYAGSGNDHPNSLAVDAAGSVYVTGTVTLKYLNDGTALWTNESSNGSALAIDSGGNVYVTGFRTTKYLADGTAVWTNSGGSALVIDSGGNVYVTGGGGTGKYLADGTGVWANYNAPGTALAVDMSSNVYIVGSISSTGSFDYATIKISSSPQVRYTPPTNFIGTDIFTYVIRDSVGQMATGTVSVSVAGVPPRITTQPFSEYGVVGSNVTFSVSAAGSPPLSYQWIWNQTNRLAGETNTTLRIQAVTSTNSGSYQVAVSNSFGVVTSTVAFLTVAPFAPSPVLINPQLSGNSLSFRFFAVAGAEYEVQLSSVLCAGFWTTYGRLQGTGGVLTFIDNSAFSRSRFYRVLALGSYRYSSNVVGYANVSFTVGDNLFSNPFKITPVNHVQEVLPTLPISCDAFTCPAILRVGVSQFNPGWECAYFDGLDWLNCDNGGPSAMTLSPGEGASLYTEVPFNVPFVGEVLEGALTNNLPAGLSLISSVVPCAGRITSELGFPTEQGDTIYKLDRNTQALQPHTFLGNGDWSPQEPTIEIGESFWAELGSARNWVRQFSVSGDTSSGGYSITNRPYLGDRVAPAPPPKQPTILTQPQSRTNLIGTDAVFSVIASGTPPLHYQWRSNSVAIPSATNFTLIVSNVQPTTPTNYHVVVSNAYGSTNSQVARLTVTEPPLIISHPTDQEVVMGGQAIFAVMARGTPPLTYQWQFNGTNLTGANGTNLILLNVQAARTGNYAVVVSSAWGVVTSTVAQLTVRPYCVNVQALSTSNPMGSLVLFHVRTFDCIGSNGVANAPAMVWIRTAGTVRSIPVVTDSSGQATVTFQPLAGEAGSYEFSGSQPGEISPPTQGEFALVGMAFSDTQATHRLRIGLPSTNRVELRNLTTTSLSGLTATVVNAPTNLQVEVGLLSSPGGGFAQGALSSPPKPDLAGSATNELTYIVTALSDTPPQGQFLVRLSSTEGASAELEVNVQIAPAVPQLVTSPASLHRSMLRGDQTLVEVQLANIGGASATDIRVLIPAIPWLSLVSTQRIASLGMDETNTVTLALTPPPELAFGPYDSYILFHAVEQDLEVPFVFQCVSALQGSLQVAVIDELTFLADGAPKVTNAVVSVTEHWTGTNVASGATDASGIILFTNLVEGYYDIDVRADKHGNFGTTFLVVSDETNEVVAFLSQKAVNYTWVVLPTEDPDHYSIELQTVFEAAVPWPSLTMEPADLDLCNYAVGIHQVNLTITNHGLVRAEGLELVFPSHPAWEITPLVRNVGELAAQASVVVPVLIRRTASNGNVPSRMDGRLDYQFRGDNIIFPRVVPISVRNANAWDCTGAPLVTLEPHELEMCSFTGGTNSVNFTIRNRSALPVQGLSLAFESHVHWRIQPAVTNLGSLAPQASLVVTVQFIKTPSSVSGASRITGKLGYQATLESETRSFTRATILDNPNPWDCVPSPLVTIQPRHIDLCAFTEQTNSVTCTITNHSLINAEDLRLLFPSHPRWRFEPSVTNLGSLAPQTSLTVPIRVVRTPSPTDGPADIAAHLDYHATVEGETRSFSPAMALNNANPWDCVSQPPAIIGPDYLNLCFFRSVTNAVNFTIHNRSSVPAAGARLAFGSHPQWLIQPAITNFGTLPPHTNFTVRVLFIRTLSTTRGSHTIASSLSYDATVENQTRNFSVPVLIYNANDSDCVPPLTWRGTTVLDDDRNVYRYLFVRGTLQFQQTVTVSRNTFTATLEIVNNSDSQIGGFGVELDLQDIAQQSATNRFGVRLSLREGLSAVDGTGTLETNSTGRVSWTLIPATNAAPTGPTQYTVGGTVRYVLNGEHLNIPLYPVPITVLPDPRLRLDYFWERFVYSDDPLTAGREPTVPFAVGMIMRNEGLGTAKAIQIETAKPKIVDNASGLLIDFDLIEAQVGNQRVPPDFTLALGDLAPNHTKQAIWWMTASLQAEFIEYEATFTHLDDLGQRNLSLIDSVHIHPLLHLVRDHRVGADGLPDFLVMDMTNAPALPDHLYLSEGSVSNVTSMTDGTVDGPASLSHSNILLTVPAVFPAGWVYLRIPDPSHGSRLSYVERSDGRRLLDDNFWTTRRIVYRDGEPPHREEFLHLFDYNTTGSYTLGYNGDLYIIQQPQSILCIAAGTTATFSVEAGGAGPFAYQWYKSGTNLLAGETNAFYTIASVQTNDAGFYSVKVSNAAGLLWSGSAELTVCLPPTITTQPQHRTNMVGETATFTVVAIGTTPLTYQWFKDGTALSGATGPSLVIPNVQTNNAGEYRVRIVNAAGNTISPNARLVVLEPPCLESISNRSVVVGRQLVITNRACDTNRSLTFTLCAGPAGAAITTNGVFKWTPTCSQGSSTNLVCVRAIDTANPILSTSLFFVLTVPECIEAGLGNTVMLAGQTSSVPVRLLSTTALTNMSFIVGYPAERFDTNFALIVNSPQVVTQQWILVEPGQIKLSFTLPATNILYGPTNIGRLNFTTVSNQSSAFVWLLITDVNGLKPDGSEVANAYGYPGRVVIIGREPLLEAQPGTNSNPLLTLYGNPGITYTLQTATNLSNPVSWSNAFPVLVPLTNLFQSLVWTNRNEPTLFFRAVGP